MSKCATIVSPVSRSRSDVRKRVVSAAPSATAPPTACISRRRCPGMRTSVESAMIDWLAETARERDFPHEIARFSESFTMRRSIVSDLRLRS